MPDTPLLQGKGLQLSFGQTPALRGADVTVNAAEVLAVMGPSGSGKSTLLHCLAGILVPDDGEVVFDGARINDMNENERTSLRREQFGFVFQFGQLVPELSAAGECGPSPFAVGHFALRRHGSSTRVVRAA